MKKKQCKTPFKQFVDFFYRKFKIVIEEGKTQEIRWPHVLIFCKGKTLQVEINISDFLRFYRFFFSHFPIFTDFIRFFIVKKNQN